MSIKRILVPIRGDGKGEGVLDHALALAGRSQAHIKTVHCRPRPEDMIPHGVVLPKILRDQIKSSASGIADAEEGHLKELFDAYVAEHQLTVTTPEAAEGSPGTTISWNEETGKQPDVIGRLGRLADVIAVAQPDHQAQLGFNSLRSALTKTGKPVLMCPPKTPQPLGHHIAISWNGSVQSARLVALALPLIAEAEKVSVITVDTGKTSLVKGEEFLSYLHGRGVEAEFILKKADRHKVGPALLAAASEAGADILAMGAYGQDRSSEILFGGVTQYVVDHAEIPLLLAH